MGFPKLSSFFRTTGTKQTVRVPFPANVPNRSHAKATPKMDANNNITLEPVPSICPVTTTLEASTSSNPEKIPVVFYKGDSNGVNRIKAINTVMTKTDRRLLYACVMVISAAYGLDGCIRNTLQNYATAELGQHSLLAMVNVLRAVIGTVTQPTAGKIANVFGRMELIGFACAFYSLGSLIQGVSNTMAMYSLGAAIYQAGYTLTILLIEVLVGDSSSTADRVWVSYIPALPFLITPYIAGAIMKPLQKSIGWRWGIGIWTGLFPAACAPLIILLIVLQRRTKRQGIETPQKKMSAVDYFNAMDVPGILLVTLAFGALLIPLTIATGPESWTQPHILAPLAASIPFFAALSIWEFRYARDPIIPRASFRKRGIWAPMVMGLFLNLAYYMQGDYLFTALIVCFKFTEQWAVVIGGLYSMVGCFTGFFHGLLLAKIRRLKYSIVIGTVLMSVALGLMYYFRGFPGSSGQAGIATSEALLGFAGGLYPYPVQGTLQMSLPHEEQSSMLGLYLAMYNIGSAGGNAISGVIWRQVLPQKLAKAFPNDPELAAKVFADPINTAKSLGDSPERAIIASTIGSVQGLLCMVGLALSLVPFVLGWILPNYTLNDKQTLAIEGEDDDDEKVMEFEDKNAS